MFDLNERAGGMCNAALPSVHQHLIGTQTQDPGYVSDEACNAFLLKNCNKHLSSIGVCIEKNKPMTSKFIERYQKQFDKFKNQRYLQDVEVMVDSGGFSIQVGQVLKEDVPLMIQLYHQFLETNYQYFSYAFMLDIMPGYSDCIYDTFAEMEEKNKLSYERSAQLPEEIRKKMLYIHHFRTPNMNRAFKKLMFEDGLADYFENFSTGGLVAFNKSRKTIPVTLYVIPLTHMLIYAKKRGLKKFRWHILGATEFKEILTHKLLEHHIRKVHGIDIEMTFDSSTMFKTLALGRYVYTLDKDEKILRKMTLREDLLHNQWHNQGKIEDVYMGFLNDIARQFGMKELSKEREPIYKDHVMTRLSYMYGMFHVLDVFNTTEKVACDIVKEIYPIYESGETALFDAVIEKHMVNLNCGVYSKNIDSRTVSVYNSLKVLEKLDMEYCDYLVNSYLGQDECVKFMGTNQQYF